jgi:hypothetical protein
MRINVTHLIKHLLMIDKMQYFSAPFYDYRVDTTLNKIIFYINLLTL